MLAAWKDDSAYMKVKPGFISAQLIRGIGGSRVFTNVAVWESTGRLLAAFSTPEFARHMERFPTAPSSTRTCTRRPPWRASAKENDGYHPIRRIYLARVGMVTHLARLAHMRQRLMRRAKNSPRYRSGHGQDKSVMCLSAEEPQRRLAGMEALAGKVLTRWPLPDPSLPDG